MRNKTETRPGASPDPRTKAVRRRLLEKHRKKKGKKSRFSSLGKITEENTGSNKTEIQEESTYVRDGEDESLSNTEEKPPLNTDLYKEDAVIEERCLISIRGSPPTPSKAQHYGLDLLMDDANLGSLKKNTSFITKPEINEVNSAPSSSKILRDLSTISSSSLDFSTVNRENECSFSSPEQVREDDQASSVSSCYTSYEDFDFSTLDSEPDCSQSYPEQVIEAEEDSQIDREESTVGQGIHGNKNSTLMDVSRAQAIHEMPGPLNISEISVGHSYAHEQRKIPKSCDGEWGTRFHGTYKSPVIEEYLSDLDQSHSDEEKLFDPASILVPDFITEASLPEERYRSQRQWKEISKDFASPSTFVSGKSLHKIRKDDKCSHNSANPNPCGSMTSEEKILNADVGFKNPVNKVRNSIAFKGKPSSNPGQPRNKRLQRLSGPKPVSRIIKNVRFCDPLTTEIPRNDVDDEAKSTDMDSESILPPTRAEVYAIVKELSATSKGMFLHHPILRILEKTGTKYF